MSHTGRADLRGADSEVLQILALQSGDPGRIRGVLDPRNPLSASLLPHVIPMLGSPMLAGHAMQALQQVAPRHPGPLIDALLGASHSAVVRRRLARVLSVCRTQLVAEGLLMALEDGTLDVRIQCARSLFRVQRQSPEIRLGVERMLALVRDELGRGAPDLGHLFTLLSFIVPLKPLRAAYRGLRGDYQARGMALEYLNETMPQEIREDLLAKLEERPKD